MASSARKRRKSALSSAPVAGSGWSWSWLPYAAVILAALIAHSPSLDSPFQFDDLSLPGDPAMGSPDGWIQILTDPVRTRPLTYLTYWANERWGGFDPWGFHAVNLGLFGVMLGAAAVVYRRLVPPIAAVGALAILALHPLQTESVAYIFARATMLAAVFFCLHGATGSRSAVGWRSCGSFWRCCPRKKRPRFPCSWPAMSCSGGGRRCGRFCRS